MLPSKWPSCIYVSNSNNLYRILKEICLLKKYEAKNTFFKFVVRPYGHNAFDVYPFYINKKAMKSVLSDI